MAYLLYLAHIMASFFSLSEPGSEFGVYCHMEAQVCHIDREYQEGTHEESTVWRGYPYECVNGTYMMVNRSGWPSGSENVFDVGPHNPSTTTWNNCETNRRWGWLNGMIPSPSSR